MRQQWLLFIAYASSAAAAVSLTRFDGGGLDLALNQADEALYAAKNAGRDQLRLAA